MDWTEEYRPETLDDVQGNKSARRDLRKWAAEWDQHGKAVILHGRPGIGKTTAAHALANDEDWPSIEMNASEQRTKDVVNKIAGSAANMGTLQAGVDGQRLVILDEADSLHGNVDRGGTGAMTGVVKEAEQPVILVANDFYDMSRGLRNACKDIEFDLVDNSTIARHLRSICESEDIDATNDALKAIASKSDGDVRGAVNDLQAVSMNVDGTLTVDDLPTGTRDREEDMFAFLDTLFQEGTPQEAREAGYSVDETPDNLFNWIEDNITAEYEGDELWKAYSFLARADEWLGRVYSGDFNFKYWKYASDQMTAGVAASRDGHHGGWTRYGPPSFWMKLGQTSGKRNTRDSIARRIAENSNVSMGTAKDEVLPFLATITHHCKNRDVTVAMAAVYELDEKEVSFITGSGESTNKVEDIVRDAETMRAEAAVADDSPLLQGIENSDIVDSDESSEPGETDTESSGVGDDDDGEEEEDDEDHTQTTLF
jgi:replication factor C large subunit